MLQSNWVAGLPGGFHFRKEVGAMSTYEILSLLIAFATLVVTIYIGIKK